MLFNRMAIFWIFGSLMFVLLRPPAFAKQTHVFQLSQDGAKLEYRVSLEKDTFVLLEDITGEIWIKNTSSQTFKFRNKKMLWWVIKDEKNNVYKHFTAINQLHSYEIKAGDSVGGQITLSRILGDEDGVIDRKYPTAHFPIGSFSAFFGPDTIPLTFHVSIDPASKNHRRRTLFWEFDEVHQPGKHSFDTTLGVPTSLFSSTLSEGITKTNFTVAAYEFFELHKELYGIAKPRAELKVHRAEESELGPFVVFKQLYQGVEVWQSDIRAFFSRAKKLYNIEGTFLPDINISPIPRIDKKLAILKALRDLKLPGNYKSKEMESYGREGEPATTLILLPFEGKYFLTWHVVIYIDNSNYGWKYFINANSGEIIHKAQFPTAIE